MRRGVVLAFVVAVALIVGWRACDRSDRSAPAGVGAKPVSVKRVDPKKLARGSIAGTVVDEAKAPIAGAFVCAVGTSDAIDPVLLRDPSCVTSDAGGGFRIESLVPARYGLQAAAKSHRPGHVDHLDIALGVSKTDVVVMLRGGGVELSGVVADLTGGPIANARVLVGGAFGETAADGTFSLWVASGDVSIEVSADGYASASENTRAPRHVELFLTPAPLPTSRRRPGSRPRIRRREGARRGVLEPSSMAQVTQSRTRSSTSGTSASPHRTGGKGYAISHGARRR